MKKLIVLLFFYHNINAQISGAGVVDIDANQYPTVLIGTQEWMAENLRTSRYSDGSEVPNIIDANQWGNLTSGAWTYYNNDSLFQNSYGKLYNWYTVIDSRNICPTGWHIPDTAEWSILNNFLDSSHLVGEDFNLAGGKLKGTGTQYWISPNLGANNETGFTGLPGGARMLGGSFNSMTTAGYWWSKTPLSWGAFGVNLNYNTARLDWQDYYKTAGYSLRCLKGAVAGIETIKLPKKQLIKITDLLGQESEFKTNTILIYIYSDGSTEKIFILE